MVNPEIEVCRAYQQGTNFKLIRFTHFDARNILGKYHEIPYSLLAACQCGVWYHGIFILLKILGYTILGTCLQWKSTQQSI